jgi:hypothetical protein
MQFLQTNAIDLNGLLIAIKNFLSAHGWTVLADGTGGGGLTLEMTNANGHDFSSSLRQRLANSIGRRASRLRSTIAC